MLKVCRKSRPGSTKTMNARSVFPLPLPGDSLTLRAQTITLSTCLRYNSVINSVNSEILSANDG